MRSPFALDCGVITRREIDTSSGTTGNKPSRLPVFLSIAFPGAGQIAQKRWGFGILFIVPTVLGVVMFLFESARLLYTFYSLALRSDVDAPSPRSMLAWLGFTLAIYILAIWDTNDFFKRTARKQNRERMESRLQDTLRTAAGPPPLPPQQDAFTTATQRHGGE